MGGELLVTKTLRGGSSASLAGWPVGAAPTGLTGAR
jgi:hypothetical protein